MADCLLVVMSVIVDVGTDMGLLDSIEQTRRNGMSDNLSNVGHGGRREREEVLDFMLGVRSRFI